MAKNKKHIPQKPDDQYPKPDISADDAWKDMFNLLETELPKNTEGQNFLKKAANSSNYIAIKVIVTTLIIATAGFLVFEKNKSEAPSRVNQTSITNIPTDSTLSVSHEKYETQKSAETILNIADSIPQPEETAETKPDKEDVNAVSEIATPGEKSGKPKKEYIVRDNAKNIEPTHKSAVNNSRPHNQRGRRIGNSISGKNEPTSYRAKANEPDHINFKPETASTRASKFTLSTPKENPSNSGESNLTKKPGYQVFTINNRKINSSNRLEIIRRNLNKQISIPLIIKDSTSSKQNRAFWNSLHAGLIWNANIPFQSGTSMLTQANGKKQIWPILIPGIWISKEFDSKNSILLWGKLDNQQFSNKLIQKTDFRTSDSAGRYYEKFLLVNQAFQLGIQYNRTIWERFQLGAGITYNHTNRALLHGKETVYPDNRIQSDTTYSIQKSNLDWAMIKPSYVSGRLEAVYSFGKIKTGVALTIPMSTLTDSVKTRPVNGQIFLRWQIR